MRQANEPSVEEILDSIKKVIARDNRAEEEREERASPQASADPDADEDVLELASIAEPDESEASDAPLVAEDAAISMRDSFAALAMLAEPGAQPQIVRSGETSLEGMTRDLLRPALAAWLDTNLPPLVERMVAQEISRIVGKKR
jgi:cell pole-organizing protein PopZ